ncbi:MAG: NAD(P)-dependent oxidoreductase [Elusimicrobiota bacterium]
MKNILLTGATGFLGSYVLKALINDYNVIILKRSFSDTWRIEKIINKVKFYDIDKTAINKIFDENKIDVIAHTAVEYGNGKSADEINKVNIELPIALLESGIRKGLKCFINTDTFFNRDDIKYTHLLDYSLSKKHLLEKLKKYAGKTQILNMRMEHIYGPLDRKNKFVVNIIHRILSNELSIDMTPGSQKRDFLFIEDAALAFKLVLDNISKIKENYIEFGIGRGVSNSIKEFIEIVLKITKSKSKINFGALTYRDGEIMDSRADTKALKALTGWAPETSIKDGLMKTIEYMKL